jgi:ribosomal protein S18 acetylase RimI-like enzyme
MRHPQHDQILEAARAWYRTSYAEMGYVVEERLFGWYNRNAAGGGHVTLRPITPEQASALLEDVRSYYEGNFVDLYVDDRKVDATLGPVLAAAGYKAMSASSYLTYVGQPFEPTLPAGVAIEAAGREVLREYALTKLKGFANSDDAPPEGEVADEVALREAELHGEGRLLIARIDSEAAAIAGWYTAGDALIFQLATRVGYRRRGIATALLGTIVREELSDGARSVVINADEDGEPIKLYRRLGFTDEVYWRRPYRPLVGTA